MKTLKQGINEMKFDAVFFDWGGTLFNPHPSNSCGDPTPQEVMAKGVERATALLNLFGRDVKLEEMRAKFAKCKEQAREKYGPAYTLVRAIEYFYQSQGWANKPEEILCIAEAYVGPRYRSYLYPNTVETIQELHKLGLILGIISNNGCPGWILDRILKGVGLLDFFSIRLYSGEEGVEKPDKEIFKRAERLAKVDTKKILHVGDSIRADVQGAKAMGWKTAFRQSKNVPSSNGLADFEFADNQELLNYIKGG